VRSRCYVPARNLGLNNPRLRLDWDERRHTNFPCSLSSRRRESCLHWYTGMALDPNNARTGVARYLLGVGPMPPPTPQDLALARLHRALDGGAFEHPWNANLPPQATPLANPGPVQGATRLPFCSAVLVSIYHHIACVEERRRRLDVHLPYGCGNRGKDHPPVVTILTFDIDDVPQQDFLWRERSCFWAGGI
jgi:hypothetical protein